MSSGLYPSTAGALIGFCQSVAPSENPTLADGRLSGSSTSKEQLMASLVASCKANSSLSLVADTKLATGIKRILEDIPAQYTDFVAKAENAGKDYDIHAALNVGTTISGKSIASQHDKAEEKAQFNRTYQAAIATIVACRSDHTKRQAEIAAAKANERKQQDAVSAEAAHAFLQQSIAAEASNVSLCFWIVNDTD